MLQLPELEYLKSRLDYDPLTGHLTWKHHPRMPLHWNNRWNGKIAGTKDHKGYIKVSIDGVNYFAHLLIWYVMTGSPKGREQIDHINEAKDDNRLANLREATQSENQRNRSKPKSSNPTSRYKGINKVPKCDRWRARIKLHGTLHYLGLFKTEEEARDAYWQAALTLHGEYAKA